LSAEGLRAARGAALLDDFASDDAPHDPELATVIEHWDALTTDVRAAIVAMVEAARKT
jgi:hypothetical protein